MKNEIIDRIDENAIDVLLHSFMLTAALLLKGVFVIYVFGYMEN